MEIYKLRMHGNVYSFHVGLRNISNPMLMSLQYHHAQYAHNRKLLDLQ